MVFSTHIFLFYFLPLTLLLYHGSPQSLRMPVLTGMSYLFYGWTNPWFLLILWWSTVVDFVSGNFISGHWRLPGRDASPGPDGQSGASLLQRRLFLTLSLLSNIGMLGFFKYFMFCQENVNYLIESYGYDGYAVLAVLLPVGISFYTFESISYNLDIYFGRSRPASAWIEEADRAQGLPIVGWFNRLRIELRGLIAFACYITQFPHLVAGPIIRYQDLERQLHQREHSASRFARGIAFFCLGLTKKVLLANPMGDIADACFDAGPLSTVDAWYGMVAYAFQLYFDFSGYSDMAIGLALMFGFVFPKNFDSPYLADSITNLWQRWHLSLSIWLRDYIYVPLGGNRMGEFRTYVNLMAVMLIGGFWHGASWNFLIWGAIHGCALAGERMLGKDSLYSRAPRPLRIAITFTITCFAWVFFRAETLPLAWDYCRSLIGAQSVQTATAVYHATIYDPWHLGMFAVAAITAFFGIQTWDFTRTITPAKAVLILSLFALSILVLWTQTANPFLYFRF